LLLIGARQGRYGKSKEYNKPIQGSNIPLATTGGFLLWIGFYGLNTGASLAYYHYYHINDVATIFVNTSIAAACGLLVAMLLSRIMTGKTDITILFNGAIVGLVAIAPLPASPHVATAAMIGAIGGVLVVFAIRLLDKCKIDDPIGVIASNGVGGIWGLIAVACTREFDDLRLHNVIDWQWYHQLLVQITGIAVIFLWVFATSFALLLLIRLVMGLRVASAHEFKGLDLVDCGMAAYPEFTKSQTKH